MPTQQPIFARKKLFYSLRSQILASFLVLFYFCLVVITLCYLYGIPNTPYVGIVKEAENKSFDHLNLVADLKKERLQRWLEERRADIRLLAQNEQVFSLLESLYLQNQDNSTQTKQYQNDFQQLRLYLIAMQNAYKVYEEITIAAQDTGQILVSTASVQSNPSYVDPHNKLFPPGADEQIVLEQGDQGQIFLEIHRMLEVSDDSGTMKARAVISAKINTDDFIRPMLHSGQGLGITGESLLVTQDRKIVTSLRYPLPDGSTARLLSYQISARPARFAAGGQEGVISAADYRGIPVLAAYRHIQITSELHWGMVVKIDRDEVYETLQNNILALFLMISTACLLIGYFAFFFSRKFSHALAEMVKVTEKVESGDLDIRVEKKSNDEIGTLAVSLNTMIDRLQVWHEQLETKVQERTSALEKTTAKLSREIEERKAATEELRLQSEITTRMAEGASLVRMDGIIVYTNPKFAEMFGYEPEEMIGKHASILHYPTSRSPEDTARKILEILDKKGQWQGEIQNIKKDGTPFWCYASVVAFDHSRHGKVLVAVHNDITERKRAEEEKNLLESRLMQAQKMEAIGALAGGIAHDFNNILSIILGYADLAREEAPPDTEYKKDIEQILLAADRAKELVKQILAFSRQTQVERMPMKIQPLLKESLKMLRSSIPTTISITESIDPVSGTVLADPTQIHQILMNLCTNAYHAMSDEGGALSVTLKTSFIEPNNPLPLPSGEYIELIVSDTGCGIGPDVIGKIFDPYFTTKEIGQGTGMGLAIIHGIIKNYGGTITVESKLGQGSAFHVYFPVITEETLPQTKDSEDIFGGQERILFIDDEAILAEMGKNMLEKLGYHVTVRRSSLEALQTFQNNPEAFDLVITDQTMPDMTGSDLSRRMLQIRPDIPIILYTGYSNLVDEDSAKAMGIKGFALKPLTKNAIAKLIRQVLSGDV